jgi:hypothetical protein
MCIFIIGIRPYRYFKPMVVGFVLILTLWILSLSLSFIFVNSNILFNFAIISYLVVHCFIIFGDEGSSVLMYLFMSWPVFLHEPFSTIHVFMHVYCIFHVNKDDARVIEDTNALQICACCPCKIQSHCQMYPLVVYAICSLHKVSILTMSFCFLKSIGWSQRITLSF